MGIQKDFFGIIGIWFWRPEKGGLDFGSLEALNHVLIQKWRWHFVNEINYLWVKVISSLYGCTSYDIFSNSRDINSGMWSHIIGFINTMHERGIIPYFCLRKKLGAGVLLDFG